MPRSLPNGESPKVFGRKTKPAIYIGEMKVASIYVISKVSNPFSAEHWSDMGVVLLGKGRDKKRVPVPASR